MTQDEIIEMAKQANGEVNVSRHTLWIEFGVSDLEAFAKLVADKEREACAKVCDEYAKDSDWPTADNCANAIRARSKA